jgi:predicted DNA-binding transcriptional regulator AlpA
MVSMSTQTPANDPTQLQSLDILSPRTVEAKLGLDATTIWRMRRRQEFPEPISLSPGRKGYLRRDVEAGLTARATNTR